MSMRSRLLSSVGSRVAALGAVVLTVIATSAAAPAATGVGVLETGRGQEPLRVGDPLPTLKGRLLTGREAALPQAALGKVTLVAVGFTYQSRFPVEAWADWYRKTVGSRADVTLFEVPMIGGMATLGRWFIERGMRSGTPADLHDRVLTVYGGTGEWKRRLSYSREHEDDAYLIVMDRKGTVRWLHHGAFDQARADDLRGVLASLGEQRTEADRDPAHRRREP